MIQEISTAVAATSPPSYSYWIGPAASIVGPAIGGVLTLAFGWSLYSKKIEDDRLKDARTLLSELSNKLAEVKTLDLLLYTEIEPKMEKHEVYAVSHNWFSAINMAVSATERCLVAMVDHEWTRLLFRINARLIAVRNNMYDEIILKELKLENVKEHQHLSAKLEKENDDDLIDLIAELNFLYTSKKTWWGRMVRRNRRIRAKMKIE